MTTSTTGTLRLFGALIVVVAVGVVGFFKRSPLTILLFTPVLTALYAFGKWPLWKAAYRQGGVGQVMAAIVVTLPVQGILAALLYLVGYGLGALLSDALPAPGLEVADALAAGALLAVESVLSVAINLLEAADAARATAGAIATVEAGTMNGGAASTPDSDSDLDRLEVDPAPLTVETFFESAHWSHLPPVSERVEGVLPDAARTPEGLIEQTEARLGVKLPETLRALYRRQNGGYVGNLYVPHVENPRPIYDDWRGVFSHDYCDLVPLERLRTLREAYLDFTEADDDDAFPENAEHFVVLSQRYLDTTYLDYSKPGEPRVGIVDFEGSRKKNVHFESFDAFFAALRRARDEWAGED